MKTEAKVTPEQMRTVMEILAATYRGRGAVELGEPYRVLVSTVISQRTREEQTAAVSRRVLAHYPDVASLAVADEQALLGLLAGSEYREAKAPRLVAMAKILLEKYGGRIPDDIDALLALPGIGRKTANCVLIYAFNREAICVDTHLHKIANRLGWVTTKTPEQTEKALKILMPRDLWAGSNRLFLQHGRAVCLSGAPPLCSRCPVRPWCVYGQEPTARKR
ncbi:endonuclease III [Gloeobacter morelensis MG652769]|uniref:Endonuclease III n=2 Tax=Gloeobacter TaxID=33071 RepID=A0ABY3PRK5_9CYAN|nr:endonuclease III [Gloeobacter morelensis MG652769]